MMIQFVKRVAAVTALSAALCGMTFAQSAPIKMKLQTGVPSASIYFELMKNFGERVDKMSNGRLKVEVLPDGAVVGAFGILDAVDKGVVENEEDVYAEMLVVSKEITNMVDAVLSKLK